MKYKLLVAIALLLTASHLWLLLNNGITAQFNNESILLVFSNLFVLLVLFIYPKKPKDTSWHRSDHKEHQAHFYTPDELEWYNTILINHFPDFLCLKDDEGRWLAASDFYLSLFNLQEIEYLGKTDAELFHYASINADILKVSFLQDKSAWHLKNMIKETKTVLLNRKKNFLEITRTPVFNKRQREQNIILTGYFIDADNRKKVQAELLPRAFEACHLNLLLLDKNFNISDINTELSLSTAYSYNELIGKPLSFLIKGKLGNLQADFFAEYPRKLWSGELVCSPKNGQEFPVKLEIAALTREDNSIVYFASLFNITQQKQAENRIIKLSYYDELTGLLNRATFYEKVRKFIHSSKAANTRAAVFIIDLDRFKVINESLGYDIGNQVLQMIARRIQEFIGANDIAARLSGDEFAVLMLSEQSYEQTVYNVSLMAGKLNQKLSEVVRINQHDAIVGSSIGISIYPEDCRSIENALKAETLLKNASIARNNVKKQAKNSYQFFNKDLSSISENKLLMELNLRKAITRNELKLYYQPQYMAGSRKLCGAEVLVRWYQNNNKMIPPDQFIALAEDTGLIIEIGHWILKTACQQLQRWIDQGYPLTQVSVNISAPQFNDTNFLNSIKQALDESGLEPRNLELEITESLLIGDARFIDLQLNQLKKMGVKLALDDFGTGYSSLSYLKDFPIDMLKMDKSFVRNMTLDSKDARLACAIIEIGHSLKQLVIAEGVETQEQFDFLRKRGCDIIQGYFFSKPLDTQEMTAFLKSGHDKWEPVKKNPFLNGSHDSISH